MNKDMMAKGYEPKDVESKWYKFWEENGLFEAEGTSDKPPYCIVIPPPNVTGVLHMGHALNNTLQDILCRFKRMTGHNVLWQPGTDHAGIATQNVVEKDLDKKGTDRHEIGRDKFIDLVWEWREEYGSSIINQLKRLGSSCDWSRERFTMDEGLSKSVKEVFVRLYDEGLIYRGDYIINWCTRCHTAIADIEVDHKDMESSLYKIRYPFKDGEGYLIVATTRPETLLGDSAVAVNPDDERYQSMPSKEVLLPILNKPVPVILDKYVDTEFGTGALKITPAHDPNDFEIGNKHNLERVKVIDENGKMNELAGPYSGMDRFECREQIIKDLDSAGLLEGIEPYENSVGHCYRCKTMIEPLLSKQWFVKTAPLAKEAIEAVKTGKTKILPVTWEKTYFEWMNNIRDWCVSRQIWWGHRIPAYYCDECGEVTVSKEAPLSCKSCSSENIRQDSDVLDTWFSSALWPFSTLGWPDKSPELETFYPTSALVTGFDILFFWVARMMMMGLHFMEEVPFKDVYIHALVRDEHGKKMSKSTGNVIDPLEVIEKFGTDSFRFTLAAFAAQGRDVKLSEDRILGYRNFVNKIWNSARFVLMNLDENENFEKSSDYTLADRWILTRLGMVSADLTTALEEFRFNDAASKVYQFVWHEFCDWYLEMAKPGLYGEDDNRKKTTMYVLNDVLSSVLRLLHPFMPFITEEIWHRLPRTDGSIMKASFPEQDGTFSDSRSIDEMELVMGVITGVRNIRGEMSIAPSKKVGIEIEMPEQKDIDIVNENMAHIRNLAGVDSVKTDTFVKKPEASATAVFGKNQVHVLLKGLIDFDEEKNRLKKEIQKIEKEMVGSTKKLSNKGFLDKAPDEIVAKVRDKVAAMNEKIEKLTKNLNFFEAIND